MSARTFIHTRSDQTIRIRNITKHLGNAPVLKNVSLKVNRGQIVALLGPNGVGKTTLLRVLLGLAAQDSGEAWIKGRPFTQLNAPLRSVGAVIGNSTLDPRLSASANLRVYAAAYGITATRIDDVLRMVGLYDVQKKPVKAYSLGMKKRLAIAASLLTDPTFLVLDEPSNGLDPAGMQWLKQLLVTLAHQHGTGVLVSSHMLADLEDILDSVVILHAGQVCYAGDVDDLRGEGTTRVLVEDERTFLPLLWRAGLEARATFPGIVEIYSDRREEVGRVALASAIALRGLEFHRDSLTCAYFRILRAQEESRSDNKRRETVA